jgi:hypothetical protein
VTPLRIVVSGMVAGDPDQGGATWAVLQYVLGLRRLGHDVLLVEPVDALTPERISSFEATMREFGLGEASALVAAGSRTTCGLEWRGVRRWCRSADVLLNLSGMLRDPELIECIPVRVYLDLDPAFNQLWSIHGIDVGFGDHTHFVTVGQRIGSAGCEIPTCDRRWIVTLPPVVLERWPVAGRASRASFTTVGNWRAYGSIQFRGHQLGQKAHSMRELLRIPAMSRHAFELAFAIHPDERRDLVALASNRWRIIDARALTGTPTTYHAFVQASFAEIGIAKSGYVVSRCGWFSDRSACYLASGRPVVAQDTGFDVALPTGEGLLVYADAEGAVAAADAVHADYGRHRRAARAIAEEHLDSDRVLFRLLEQVGVA